MIPEIHFLTPLSPELGTERWHCPVCQMDIYRSATGTVWAFDGDTSVPHTADGAVVLVPRKTGNTAPAGVIYLTDNPPVMDRHLRLAEDESRMAQDLFFFLTNQGPYARAGVPEEKEPVKPAEEDDPSLLAPWREFLTSERYQMRWEAKRWTER